MVSGEIEATHGNLVVTCAENVLIGHGKAYTVMASDRGVDSLTETIQQAVDYHAREFHMTIAEGLGVLEYVKFKMMDAHDKETKEDDGETI